jgi:aspartokinase
MKPFYSYISCNKIRTYPSKNIAKQRFNKYNITNTAITAITAITTNTTNTTNNDNMCDTWNIHSYMSSALKDSSDICKATSYVVNCEKNNKIIVVNSIYGTNELMQEIINNAESGDLIWKNKLIILYKLFELYANEILIVYSYEYNLIIKEIYNDFINIKDLLLSIYLTKTSLQFTNIVLSYCEKWSALIFMYSCMKKLDNSNTINIKYMDTRDIILLLDSFTNKNIVMYEQSKNNLNEFLKLQSINLLDDVDELVNIIIVPGKICKTQYGHIGRLYTHNGDSSVNIYPWDSTAVLLGNLIGAKNIIFWTHINGIYVTNLSLVPDARQITELTYAEAHAIVSLSDTNKVNIFKMYNINNIPISIKNFNNTNPNGTFPIGTLISNSNKTHNKCIATMNNISIINIYNSGIKLNELNTNETLLSIVIKTLHDNKINIIMVCNAFSNISVCIAVMTEDIEKINKLLDTITQKSNDIQLIVDNACSIVSIIGNVNYIDILKLNICKNNKIINIYKSNIKCINYVSMLVKTEHVRDCVNDLYKLCN